MQDNIFSGNRADDDGGGIYNDSDTMLIITGNTFTNNIADDKGGGLYNDGMLTMSKGTFSGNSVSNNGGGLYNIGTSAITDSTFSGNLAGTDGGGLYNNGVLAVTNSTLSNNRVTNGTNFLDDGGGALKVAPGGSTTILFSTIFGNSSNLNRNDGLWVVDGSLTLSNSIVTNNGTENCVVTGGSLTSGGYNLENTNTCGFSNSGDLPNTNPLLDLLADNGGNTLTHALLPGSPAIGQIPSGVNGCGTTIMVDQRGSTRPQGSACDIGAFESQGFSLTLTGGNNQSTNIDTIFANPLEVTVIANVVTEPVGPGGVIDFTAPSSGASVSTTSFTATTNSSGVASTTVTANSIIGTYQVTAMATGVSSPVAFTLTNQESNPHIYLPLVIKNQ